MKIFKINASYSNILEWLAFIFIVKKKPVKRESSPQVCHNTIKNTFLVAGIAL
jgi:hypothetical protein